MSNCPNCLAINPFKKVHRDGAVIEICEYCNTINEEEYEEYTKKQIQNKEGADPIVTFGLIVAVVILVIWVLGMLDTFHYM
ncbi:hypothetical protein B1B04_05505 [Lysinibacillus sp. KCTC 33748]|uniref:hypothetical protein n=1 Tax=unclassified Lysinibacillus TaxID=2636778 RepID=UPI0009A8EED3|nr:MULTISPECIES: hypothetical protein [unclassified Lysinibacillus]OXS76429.1 hypothetical protein B1B04_05505 [Lysinibacillus sp. KCTC 33748]SKB45805.1 hypothetical protein SAMN06295926_102586 [Lysinibacillus sp. AC-3]